MKMKKTVFAAVVATVAFSSASASAACWFSGKPTHIWTYSWDSYTTVYTHNGSYFTYFRVPKSDPELLAHVRDAATWTKNIGGYGDAGSCPTSGTYRYAGNVRYAYVFPG